jgi:hypothetical protein
MGTMKAWTAVGHLASGDLVVWVPGTDAVCTVGYATAARAVAEALFGWL